MTDKSQLVSVIIPLYNAEKYIVETIESVLNQTYNNIEIIIINDGSTDNGLQVVEKYESESIKIFAQENKGASAARNYGLREAKGDYIQFLDADDLLSSNKIEKQVKLLIDNPEKIALCPTIHFFDGDSYSQKDIIHEWYKKGNDDPVDFLIKLYGGSLIGPSYGGMIQPNAWLTPRKIIDKAGNWNEEISVDDDGEFFCRVVLASEGIMYSFEGKNYYRKFNTLNNLSARKSKIAIQSAFLALILKRSHLLSRTNDSMARLALASYFAEFSFSCYNQDIKTSQKAQKMGKELNNEINYNLFYCVGIKRKLSLVLGWKFVKRLELLKKIF